MNIEIEAKFLNVDIEKVRQQLKELGAVCEQPMRLMRRVVIETAELHKKNGYLRVRDEGDRCTLTYKQFDELSINGAKELETTVGNFDTVVALFRQLEPTRYSYQESKRETWKLGEAEVVIDEWPWLKPYIEIEAASEDEVREVAEKIGFKWQNAAFGGIMAAYRAEYPHLSEKDTVGNLAEVRFGADLPDMLHA